jgi:ribonuclease HI
MRKSNSTNRQFSLAQKYEDQIMRQEKRDTEQIIAERCMAKTRAAIRVPQTAYAAAEIYVATYMQANPGPGAYAVVEEDGTLLAHDWPDHTSGYRLELTALIAAMEHTGAWPSSVVIYTTGKSIASYLVGGQAAKWRDNGWRKADGDQVAHRDLLERALDQYEKRCPSFMSCAPSASIAMRRCAMMAEQIFECGEARCCAPPPLKRKLRSRGSRICA